MMKITKQWLKKGRIKRIHVNQHNIKANRLHDAGLPVLTVKLSDKNVKGNTVEINGPSRLVYMPDKPLACGAHVWIETHAEVEVTT